MNRISLLLVLLLLSVTTTFGQSTDKRIYGTWTCSYRTNDDGILNNITWTFNQDGTGSFKNIASSAEKNGLVCTRTYSFTWKVNKNGQIVNTNGVGHCKCTTTGGQSSSELASIEAATANSMSREQEVYDIEFESNTIMVMGGVRTKKN